MDSKMPESEIQTYVSYGSDTMFLYIPYNLYSVLFDNKHVLFQ